MAQKKKTAQKRKKRRGPGQSFEFAAKTIGFENVAGVDEAGRGPLAGPVVAAAVILSVESATIGVADSKKLTPKRREALYQEIIESSIAYNIHSIGVVGVDRLNIYRAAMHAMKLAVEGLPIKPDIVFVDGPRPPNIVLPRIALVGGDNICCSVAAASILAKVSRDRQMMEYEEIYPGYGFASHKGYGTKEHMEALRLLGPCPIHRRSFRPVKRLLKSETE